MDKSKMKESLLHEEHTSKVEIQLDLPRLPPPMALGQAFRFRAVPMPWRKAVGAGLSLFIPIFIFSLLHHPEWGLLCTVGGFTGLYVVDASLKTFLSRLVIVMFGLVISFGLGTISAGAIWSMAVVFALVGMIATFLNNALRVAPPGAYFYILACAIGTGMPVDVAQAPVRVGFALLGGCVAIVIGLIGRLFTSDGQTERPSPGSTHRLLLRIQASLRWESLVLPAALRVGIGIFVATIIAYALGNDRPYWVPIGCAAVLQGATVAATVHRSIQRAIGTSIGILIAGFIFLLHPPYVVMAMVVLVLQTIVELYVARNYAFAVIFITPLALTIAETANVGLTPSQLVSARLVDNLLGCAIGLLTGVLLWRRVASRRLRRVISNVMEANVGVWDAWPSEDTFPSQQRYRTRLHALDIRLMDMEVVWNSALHEYPTRHQEVEVLWPLVHEVRALSDLTKRSCWEGNADNGFDTVGMKAMYCSYLTALSQALILRSDMKKHADDLPTAVPLHDIQRQLLRLEQALTMTDG